MDKREVGAGEDESLQGESKVSRSEGGCSQFPEMLELGGGRLGHEGQLAVTVCVLLTMSHPD